MQNPLSSISVIIIVVLVSLTTISIIKSLANYEPNLACKTAYSHKLVRKKPKRTTANVYNIHFIETNESKTIFDYRQLCSIESAAKHNPNAIVRVKSLKAKLENTSLFEKYPNIEFRVIIIDKYVNDTPLQNLTGFLASHPSRNTINSYYHIAHVSDALRLVTIYKYGGFYSDLDTITIRNLEPLVNYCGFCFENQEQTELTNSFFVCKKRHPVLHRLMDMYMKDYDGSWITVGPQLISKHLPIFCNASNVDLSIGKSKHECDVVTFPHRYHAPIHWTKIESLFNANTPLYAQDLKDAYQIHFNTFMTQTFKLNWNSSNFYEIFASLNCPVVYKLASAQVTSQA
jgi:lactosylceramide 4-alpha-galactosyltransferase